MKPLRYIQSVAASAVIIMLTSCEKELDFRYHDIEALPVIEASLTQNEAQVTITMTTPMDEPFAPTPLPEADVTIVDAATGRAVTLEKDSAGVYTAPFAGVTGHDYIINVTFGKYTCYAHSVMARPTTIINTQFYWIRMPGDDMAALQVQFTDDEYTEDYYWIRVYRNDKAYSWSVVPDHGASGGVMNEIITTTHRDQNKEDDRQIILDGDRVTVTVTPVSRKMADYLTALMNGSNGPFMFEDSKCLGYFLAAPVASETITYHPDEIEYAR